MSSGLQSMLVMLRPSLVRARTVTQRVFYDRFRTLGLAGSVALAVGGCAAGALPNADPFADAPIVRQLREAPAVALVVAYGGLALLVAAWLFLGRLVVSRSGPSRRSLVLTLGLWALPLMIAPPMFSRDVYSYAAQGWLVQQHANPYFWGPAAVPGPFLHDVSWMWSGTPAPYGPLFLVIAHGVIAAAAGHVVPAVLGLRLVAVAGVLLLVRYLPRLAEHCGVDARAALWLGVLNPLVLLHFISGAHNDALLVGLIVAGLTLLLDRRPVLGVAVIALAVMVKAPAGLALVFAMPVWAGQLAGRARLVRAAAATGLVSGAVVAAVTWATGLGYGWIGALQTPGTVRNWLSITTLLGEAGGELTKLVGLGDYTNPSISLFRGAGGLAALVVCLVLLARTNRRGRGPAAVGTLGVALLAVVVLSPVVQPWYLLWGFILIAASVPAGTVRSTVITVSAVLSMLLMPKGGTVDVSAIVQAVIAAAAVVASAAMFELLPSPGRAAPAPAGAASGTLEG